MNKYLMPVAVVLAGLFIGGAVMWNGSHPAASGTAGTQGAAPSVDIKDVNTNGMPTLGDANAPVTIAFWSDFQCPYCKAFEVGHPQIPTAPALPDIIKNYVNTGKVRIVFKDVAFLGADSVTGAEYSYSVWHLYPEQYFAWRTAMFTAQDAEGSGFGDAASIDKLDATVSGIDAAKITTDVKANGTTYAAMVNANVAEAQKLGVNATPSFILGTQLIQGAQPYSAFQTAIDGLLK